jgi:hypothetical protein
MFSVQRNRGIVVITLPNIVKLPQSGVFGDSRTGNIAQTFSESVSQEKQKKEGCNRGIYRKGLGEERNSHLVWWIWILFEEGTTLQDGQTSFLFSHVF